MWIFCYYRLCNRRYLFGKSPLWIKCAKPHAHWYYFDCRWIQDYQSPVPYSQKRTTMINKWVDHLSCEGGSTRVAAMHPHLRPEDVSLVIHLSRINWFRREGHPLFDLTIFEVSIYDGCQHVINQDYTTLPSGSVVISAARTSCYNLHGNLYSTAMKSMQSVSYDLIFSLK